MDAKLNYNQIIFDVNKRFNKIVKECVGDRDYNTIVSLVCSSIYSCEDDIPKVKPDEQEPVLKEGFVFEYKGYQFELASCTNITSKEQMLNVTIENFTQKFPHGVFTDRYVCWMWSHEGDKLYLVPNAWLYGAQCDLKAGSKVDKHLLTSIDNFLETFEEEDLND